MSDIKDIIKSWWTSFNPTEEQSALRRYFYNDESISRSKIDSN